MQKNSDCNFIAIRTPGATIHLEGKKNGNLRCATLLVTSTASKRPQTYPKHIAFSDLNQMNSNLRCHHCGATFSLSSPGTRHRNHCPHCLWSLHLDGPIPGDRSSRCHGPMEPIAISMRGDGEWLIVHRCNKCGVIHTNRIAGDDNAVTLMTLAARPLANPPFPCV